MPGMWHTLRCVTFGQEGCSCVLLTQTECLDDCTVAVDVAALEVVEQRTALTYETGEGTLGAVVLAVLLHVLRKVLDTEREQCNLAFCAAGVGSSLAVSREQLYLLF